MNVFNYVVVQEEKDKEVELVIIEEDSVIADSPKQAEKKIIADLARYDEGTTIFIAPFPGKEIR